ncbi:MAG: type II toxin-antitoxin system death-on-curing family toxin [Anaerolineales bacterium]|nr:type II toxin-antitoxin system death-on-curing family toxin [Anaerolineales bacterium]
MIQNHPFADGNKHTGITATVMFQKLNGYNITASNDDLEQFTFQVVLENPSIDEISA